MTTTENTTRPTETNLTRRNMLKSMAAASTAAFVLPAKVATSGEPDSPGASKLKLLIENHRRAWQTFEDHCGEADDMERAYRDKFERPLVPTTLPPEGEAPAFHELHFDHPDDVEKEIQRAHRELRSKHCSNLVKTMAPEHWQGMAEAIDQSEARCMAALEKAIEDEEARREAFGLSEAQREWYMMSEAEDAAIVDIMRYVPVTPAEAEGKSAYLRAWFSKGYGIEEHHVEALLQGQGSFETRAVEPEQIGGAALTGGDGILAAFKQWHVEYELSATLPDERQADTHYTQMRAIEDQMVEMVPTTAHAFAAKLLALTSYGDFNLDGPAESLLSDAQRITRMGPPKGNKRHRRPL